FFMWIVHEDTIPFEMIRDDQLRRLVDGLRHATRLDEYWTNDFLKKAIRRVPDSVIELAKTRIEGAIASGDWGMQPLGGVLGGGDALDLL
ncbi:hypothetical protein J8J17_22710, partial [Mycobacterium tuberculosis]|nr:hypothetical protein [Mycobacterium tuberculosis]